MPQKAKATFSLQLLGRKKQLGGKWPPTSFLLTGGRKDAGAEAGARGERRQLAELAPDSSLGRDRRWASAIVLVPLQTGLGEPVRCNFTLTDARVSSRAVSLQWRTLAFPCNFNLSYRSDTSGVAWCHPARIDNTTYGCNTKDLQAGTIYNFTIMSLDGEKKTVVLQTGKK